jgi:hypothetical protein
MESQIIPCPFVYAAGRRCSGKIYRASAYGPARGGHYVDRAEVRKYQLWCSDKDDHAGITSDSALKERMEFYPADLPPGIEDTLWAGSILG